MTARTFHVYVLARFSRTVLIVLAGILVIIFLIDFIEAVRQFARKDGFTWTTALRISVLRSLFWQDKILPFAFLFGAIAGLIGLSRRSELIVARASGISIWGLLTMPVLFALAFGALSVLVLNPIVLRLKEDASLLENDLRNRSQFDNDAGIWIRQSGADESSIIHAWSVSGNGLVLNGATAFLFDDEQRHFRYKITAETAEYHDRTWILRNAVVTSADIDQQVYQVYVLPTNLSADEVHRILAQPDALSLWALPDFIEAADQGGLKTERFHFALHELLARPFVLSAMVLIAAAASLQVVRATGLGARVLAGIGGGFLLYVMGELLRDLGGNGIVNPVLAAWVPSIVALTIGTTMLLFQEDG